VAPVPECDVDLLVDFLNTVDEDEGTDELADEAACAAWFRDHGLAGRRDEVGATTARALRTALRQSADEVPRPPQLPDIPLEVVLDGDGRPTLSSTHPLGALIISAVRLDLEDRWRRIKLCHMETCRYAYYDGSRNTSGRWCSMKVCGNRAKTRAFRERHRDEV